MRVCVLVHVCEYACTRVFVQIWRSALGQIGKAYAGSVVRILTMVTARTRARMLTNTTHTHTHTYTNALITPVSHTEINVCLMMNDFVSSCRFEGALVPQTLVTNRAAMQLWRTLDFKLIGIVPRASRLM